LLNVWLQWCLLTLTVHLAVEEKTGQKEDAINWQVIFELENDVQRASGLAKMYKVSKQDIWLSMQSATDVATWGKEGGEVHSKFGWPPRPPR